MYTFFMIRTGLLKTRACRPEGPLYSGVVAASKLLHITPWRENMDHPRFGYRFVAAKDLDGDGRKLKGLPVNGSDGEKLGNVEGFIIDVARGEPRHVAVEAGWFVHKHFLVPIGHVALASDGKALVADVTKDRVKKFPGFDPDTFEKLPADELARLDRAMAEAYVGSDLPTLVDITVHYRTPEWWETTFYRETTSQRR
jgi:sporulation protein YlmC with PRC-barrel domain